MRHACARVLAEGGRDAKPALAREVAAAWRADALAPPSAGAGSLAPGRPARPERPELKPPGQVPRRRLGTPAGRFALLHAVAHIEFNAIDLAFDMVARFSGDARLSESERRAFIADWINVGDDEARHFLLVRERLAALGGDYGDLPAHDGLWEAARATCDDLAGRLAVAPMVLEARGLDVTPGMIERLRGAGDQASAAALEVIYTEEVAHVAAGRRWFETICAADGAEPEARFQELVKRYFRGDLKRPFNTPARDRAGLPQDWYEPLGV
ncbi:MAG: ferritin-like domain-containing protein [Oceanicaulis sp.]